MLSFSSVSASSFNNFFTEMKNIGEIEPSGKIFSPEGRVKPPPESG